MTGREHNKGKSPLERVRTHVQPNQPHIIPIILMLVIAVQWHCVMTKIPPPLSRLGTGTIRVQTVCCRRVD